MTKKKKPKHPRPWEEPGHTFTIGWPPGFVPQPYIVKKPPAKAAIANLLKGRNEANKRVRNRGEGIHAFDNDE